MGDEPRRFESFPLRLVRNGAPVAQECAKSNRGKTVMIVNTYLNFAGNAEEAFKFYKSVFGGELTQIVHFKDMPMPGVNISKADENKVMHVGLKMGNDQVLMASDTLESIGKKLVPGNNVYISLHPESKAEADRLFKGLSA